MGFNISEIIKAGSLGQGTAVPGHYDIDLVIYSRGIYNYDVHNIIYCTFMQFMTNFIKQTLQERTCLNMKTSLSHGPLS